MEFMILAGGKGTRLRAVVNDRPKPMAAVGDVPFLEVVLARLTKTKCARIIILTGYMHEVIESHFGHLFRGVPIEYSREQTPLGTGGAVRQAIPLISGESFMLLNGDTFFDVDYDTVFETHEQTGTPLTMVLKPMIESKRFGTVQVKDGLLVYFADKGLSSGLINGGVYACRRDLFSNADLPRRFSLEEDFLAPYAKRLGFRALVRDDYFIDIGVPDDYIRAQIEMKAYL